MIGAFLDPQMLSGIPIFIGLGLGFIIRSLRRQARIDAELEKSARAVPERVRRNILLVTYWLAVLLERCGSEFALLKEIPPQIQIITRRVLLDKLAVNGVWEETPRQARDLLLKPDGHWTAQERSLVWDRFEFLTVLRWVTRQEETLRFLALAPKHDYRQAKEIVKDVNWMSRDIARAPAQIAARGNSAVAFLDRCWAEGISRGLVQVDEANRAKAQELLCKIERDPESTDVLYEAQRIGELREEMLRQVYRRAAMRVNLLRCIWTDMEKGQTPSGISELVLAGFPPSS
jgi:hypothetical protein